MGAMKIVSERLLLRCCVLKIKMPVNLFFLIGFSGFAGQRFIVGSLKMLKYCFSGSMFIFLVSVSIPQPVYALPSDFASDTQ